MVAAPEVCREDATDTADAQAKLTAQWGWRGSGRSRRGQQASPCRPRIDGR
jgi:hypothetical protein